MSFAGPLRRYVGRNKATPIAIYDAGIGAERGRLWGSPRSAHYSQSARAWRVKPNRSAKKVRLRRMPI
jgi:hypothetical protein